MENIKTHLKTLVQLGLADNKFSELEEKFVYNIGKAHQLDDAAIAEIIQETAGEKEKREVEFEGLPFDDRFDYLYNIITLMKIDQKVYLSEIKYCQEMAEKLGFKKKVVKSLSSKIFSDPSLTGDREALKRSALKYDK
jgi:hypothetical protein